MLALQGVWGSLNVCQGDSPGLGSALLIVSEVMCLLISRQDCDLGVKPLNRRRL